MTTRPGPPRSRGLPTPGEGTPAPSTCLKSCTGVKNEMLEPRGAQVSRVEWLRCVCGGDRQGPGDQQPAPPPPAECMSPPFGRPVLFALPVPWAEPGSRPPLCKSSLVLVVTALHQG